MTKLTEHELQEPITTKVHRDFSRLHLDQTVGEALAAIRRDPPPSRIIYFYVVDEHERLHGVIPTRRLLLSGLDQPLSEIMVRDVITIPHTATVLEACEFFVLHRVLAFPVIDEQHRIVGVVDIELYTKELGELDQSERYDDLFQLIGVHLVESQQASPIAAFRSRFPWLLTNIAGGVVAAFLAGLFEEELKNVVAIALFIPVVLALAESVSIQSLSLALQALHGQQPTLHNLLVKLRREFLTGAMLGAASAGIVAFVAAAWLRDWRVALCLLVGITGGVACAGMIGLALPNVLRMIRRDPQVAAGPVSLALADMVTLLAYFNFARWLLG
ncbi:MAG: magnesium transporter [Pirellulales bacterium]